MGIFIHGMCRCKLSSMGAEVQMQIVASLYVHLISHHMFVRVCACASIFMYGNVYLSMHLSHGYVASYHNKLSFEKGLLYIQDN